MQGHTYGVRRGMFPTAIFSVVAFSAHNERSAASRPSGSPGGKWPNARCCERGCLFGKVMTTSRTFENYLVADSVRHTSASPPFADPRVRVFQSLFRTRAVVGCVFIARYGVGGDRASWRINFSPRKSSPDDTSFRVFVRRVSQRENVCRVNSCVFVMGLVGMDGGNKINRLRNDRGRFAHES